MRLVSLDSKLRAYFGWSMPPRALGTIDAPEKSPVGFVGCWVQKTESLCDQSMGVIGQWLDLFSFPDLLANERDMSLAS